jgi:hypothetical protein
MIENNNIIPSNIGLDGTIGGECDGKWYGGAYGWGFTVVVPQTGGLAHRNRTYWGFTGFMNAYLLTGDDRYLDVWRKQRDTINAQSRTIDGQQMYPRMHGDKGWYLYVPEKYAYNNQEIYFLSMKPEDRRQLPDTGWMSYLDGGNPTYPEESLRADLMEVRRTVAAMRTDKTAPDTRLSDDPMQYNPAKVSALRELMLAGIYSSKHSSVLHSRLRYFDPVARRAGVPEDVAALVEKISADEVIFQLVNVSQIEARELIVQAGAYAEHQLTSVTVNNESQRTDVPSFTVVLEPGCGARITAKMKRHVNQPTMQFPW